MPKHADSSVLKKSKRRTSKQKKNFSSYVEFRERFQEYQRKKNNKPGDSRHICRPYEEQFLQPKRENSS